MYFPGVRCCLPIVVSTLVVATACAQASLAGPRLFPRAARIPGVIDTRYDAVAGAYLFTLRDLQNLALVEYRIPLQHADVQHGMIRVEETTTGVVPVTHGGLYYRTQNPPPTDYGALLTPSQLVADPNATPLLLAHALDSATGIVTIRYRDTYNAGGGPYVSEKTYAFRLIGRSLQITADSDATVRILAAYNHAGFTLDDGDGLPAPAQVLHVPYMDNVPVFAGGAPAVFCTRMIDWYVSNGSDNTNVAPRVLGSAFGGEVASATYRNDLNQLDAPIHEVAYLTVSSQIEDTFPVIDRPPSPYRQHTAAQAVSQCAPGVCYTDAKAWVDHAVTLGLTDMAHIRWDWSKWPFNLNDPDLLPAPPAIPAGTILGTGAQWLAYAAACNDADWSFAPYMVTTSMDPGYPNLILNLNTPCGTASVLLTANSAYDQTKCTRFADSTLKKGWDTNLNLANTNLAGQGHPVDVLGPHHRARVYDPFVQQIHGVNGFSTGGVHLDAQTTIPGWIDVDQIAGSGFDHSIAESLRSREQLFSNTKDGMTGPLFSENSHWRYTEFESYNSGLVDGTSRKIPIAWSPAQGPPDLTNWDAEVIPDFELGEVIPRATAMFGMGWESQFKGSSYPVDAAFRDAWHTTLLSYGHGAFFGTNGDVTYNYWDWRGTLGSYHLVHGLAKAMRGSRVSAVRYVDSSGAEMDLTKAVRFGLDLKHPRLVLRCQNGVEFKANHSSTTWSTTVLGVPWNIPIDGFVGAAPGGLLAFSAINPTSNRRVDYAFEPGVVEVIDRRGVNQGYNNFPGSYLPVPPGLFNPPVSDLDMVIVHDLRANRIYYANGFQTAVYALGPQPAPVQLRIDADDTTTLSLGRPRIGLRATAILGSAGSGLERDVTGVVGWVSANPTVATVNRLGGLSAVAAGQATITATWQPYSLSVTQTVTVTADPVVTAPAVAAVLSTSALLTTTTDTDCALVTFTVTPNGGTPVVVRSKPDPAQKFHVARVTGLQSVTTYTAFATAQNAFGTVAQSPPFTFTTP